MYKMANSCDIMYILGIAAGWAIFIPKLQNKKLKVCVNIDGLEWKRDKFNEFEKLMLKIYTSLAVIFSDSVVLDAKSRGNYVGANWKEKTVFIPYGVETPKIVEWDTNRLTAINQKDIAEFLIKYDYWLIVARLEPENNIHTILQAYLESSSKKPLIVVGNFTSDKYKRKIKNILSIHKNNKVLLIGGIYDELLLNMLRQNCIAYIHGHSVGGTNPSLLDAMISKNIIIAHDNEFNREVCGDCALYFRTVQELINKLELVENRPNNYIKFRQCAFDKAKNNYSWNEVVERYEKLFRFLA